ncbi:hypothetical protein AARAC_010186 [Aspergillus arachidicola]|uniref:Uncharacterized protein n=1 Tax=Aspergillus arachidicola TaxID=656916 RepID=A0A2G7FSC0_9EURO|nr:hypothetical protein AARAC_010186 [Aspergillus arachidicola]
MEVATRKLWVEESTLKRWMREQDQIVAMPSGSKRADKRPQVRAKTLAAPQQGTRETVPGDEGSFEDESSLVNHNFSYYLQLSPRQLRDMLSLTASDHRLHTFQHPVPFVGIEGGRVGKLYTFQDAYNFLDCPNIHSHPGHPLPPPTVSGSPSNERPSLNIHAESTYTSRAGESNISTLRVVDVNKQLYELAPEFGVRAPTGGYTGSYAMATSSSKVTSALPVRIELDYDCPYPGAPAQWAVLLSFGDEEVLLPLALSLWGPQTMNASRPNILYLQGWTIDHGIRISPREFKVKEYYKNIQRLFEVFRHSTVLHVMDVEPLFLRAEDRWRPRRYTSTWTLYTTPIHANYLVEGVRPQGSKAPFSDEVDAFTTSRVVKDGEGISISPYTMLQSREPDRGTDGARDVTDSIAEPEGFADTTDADEVGEATPSNRGHTKKKRLYQRSSMQRAVLKNYSLVDGKKKCLILTCPLPQELYSGYCKHHSSRIIQYVSSLKAMGAELPMPQWELKLTDDAITDVKALSTSYHGSPQNTWVIDFEYISLSGDMSPIPLQFAIRQLDGKLLLAENVHYGLSLEDFLVKLNTWENAERHVQVLITHCYGDIVTNGLRPDEIRDEIIHNLNYSAERISIISWFSPQDMQCFQRLLSGSPELIVPKESHHLCSNFQNIDVGRLLKKLLPMNWPSLSLPAVHSSLLASQGRSGDKGEYHTAAYDTEAVTDIVKEITTLMQGFGF